MNSALVLVFLSFLSFSVCRSASGLENSESSESVDLDQTDFGVAAPGGEPEFVSFNPFGEEVPLSEHALNRAKKSLTKRRMKRLSKPKYLEEKFRGMVEERPALKSKIMAKLAERDSRKRVKNLPGLNGDEIIFDSEKTDVYTVPVTDFKVYEAPVFITASPVEEPCEILSTNPNPESLVVLEQQAAAAFVTPSMIEQDCEPSRVCSRSVIDEIDRDLIVLASNPAFEVHPITGAEVFTSELAPCLHLETPAAELIEVLPVAPVLTEPKPVAIVTPESLESEPFRLALNDESTAKFKKDIPCVPTPQQIFANCLQMAPQYEFPSEFVVESLPCVDHFWAPLEPVKTYEIKQTTIDEAAIIAELKSVLGDVAGPIIIGEPGEPLIVRHYAKPYVVEYYERPVVVEHHQSTALNVFQQAPVVVDHYEPLVFTESLAEPVVTVEQVCPCA